jgi:hypothetical protein
VSLLHEISVRAKYDGWFTQEWAPLRRLIPHERGLENAAGGSDIQKLKTWAEGQNLLMDFELEFVGFSSAIRTVTFWSADHAVQAPCSGQPEERNEGPDSSTDTAAEQSDPRQASVEIECACHDVDWNSLRNDEGADDQAWRGLLNNVDYAMVGNLQAVPQPRPDPA